MESFTFTTISLTPFIQLSFYLILGGYAIFTAVLYYHWQNYATDAKVATLTYAVYALATLPLLAIMASIAFFS